MSSFKDEAYEKLDYLSQLTEVVISPQNEILANLPDRVELSYKDIFRMGHKGWGVGNALTLSIHTVLSRYNYQFHRLRDNIRTNIENSFEFEYSEDFYLDIENQTMNGSAALVKKVFQFEDKQLLETAVQNACRHIGSRHWPSKRLKERAITILDLIEPGFGRDWASRVQGKLSSNASYNIQKKFEEAILNNVWRIRNHDVIVKAAEWINDYMCSEWDNSGLVNLMKLKFMLDRDLPVYSVDEVKNVNTP